MNRGHFVLQVLSPGTLSLPVTSMIPPYMQQSREYHFQPPCANINPGVVYHPVEGVIRVVDNSQFSASNHGPAQLAGTAAPFLAQQSAPGPTAPPRQQGSAPQPPRRLSGARVLPYFKSLDSIAYFYKLWDAGDRLTGWVGVRDLPLTGRRGESQSITIGERQLRRLVSGPRLGGCHALWQPQRQRQRGYGLGRGFQPF
jgi:hypothetical protein